MRMLAFARRNTLEILRDPLTMGFGIGFPLILLVLLTTIQNHIPVSMFEIATLTPGIAIFGLSFISLFSALLVSKDRETAFLARLLTTPMTAVDFLLGYTLPLLPMALLQCVVCCLAAVLLGLPVTIWVGVLCVGILPVALFYIGMGLLLGSVLNDKQVGGICGALLTNLSAWLSGIWFDVELLGEGFEKLASFLPFVHSVKYGQALLSGDIAGIFPHIYWILGWVILCCITAALVFRRRMQA